VALCESSLGGIGCGYAALNDDSLVGLHSMGDTVYRSGFEAVSPAGLGRCLKHITGDTECDSEYPFL